MTYLNPNWHEKSTALAKQTETKSDVSGGHRVRTREMFTKSEVGYEHPAKKPNARCGLCVHFTRPHACKIVAGYIRAEDWCKKFESRK